MGYAIHNDNTHNAYNMLTRSATTTTTTTASTTTTTTIATSTATNDDYDNTKHDDNDTLSIRTKVRPGPGDLARPGRALQLHGQGRARPPQ